MLKVTNRVANWTEYQSSNIAQKETIALDTSRCIYIAMKMNDGKVQQAHHYTKAQ